MPTATSASPRPVRVSETAAATAAHMAGPKTVLVVDDEDSVRQLIVVMLELEGHRVLQAESGEQALEIAADNDLDLITLDVMMPGLDGWAVAAALDADARTSGVPRVMVSGMPLAQLEAEPGAAAGQRRAGQAVRLRRVHRHRAGGCSPGRSPCRLRATARRSRARRTLNGCPSPLVVSLWVAAVLWLDSIASLTGQRLLGVGTWVLLLAMLRKESRATRVQVGVVVVYATFIEYVCSDWLGVYVYRLENVPAFVPPGHGLVYLCALAIGRSAWAHRSHLAAPGDADRLRAVGAVGADAVADARRARRLLVPVPAGLREVRQEPAPLRRRVPDRVLPRDPRDLAGHLGLAAARPVTGSDRHRQPAERRSPAATPGSTRRRCCSRPKLLRWWDSRGGRQRGKDVLVQQPVAADDAAAVGAGLP